MPFAKAHNIHYPKTQRRNGFIFLVGIVLLFCQFCVTGNRTISLKKKCNKTWVYLPGLTSWPKISSTKTQKMLKQIADDLGIKITVIPSKFRCPDFNNKFCWPHDDDKQMFETLNYIKEKVEDNIAGFIGFSNGGFFLHELIQKHLVNLSFV